MNWFRLPLTCFCILIVSTIGWGQISLKLEPLPDGSAFGVYVKMCEDANPSGNTITGSGQVTILCPTGHDFSDLASVHGNWSQNAMVESPDESPGMSYVSVGFIMDNPQIVYQNDEETLLFTFKINGGMVGSPSLLVNETDPFNNLPNSVNSNPGNELSAIDIGVNPTGFYAFIGLYQDNGPACGSTEPIDTTTTIDTTTVIDTTTTIDTTNVDTTTVDTTVIIDPDTTGQGGGDSTLSSALVEMATKGFFTLTPNPTQEWLYVNFKGDAIEKHGTVRFWTVSGIPLGELEKTGQETLRLNVGALPDGLYLLGFVVDGKIVQRERFLKQ